jgi:UDP-N-acetylmuramoyl-tripeptide--D-alanyl-D-alanine ligase
MNALAAAAACLSLGVEPDAVQIGLESARPVKGRFQHRLSQGGIHIYDDSYNANPSSLEVALETLSGLPGKRILVLGDMAELSDESEAWHSWAGKKARSMGINALFTFGDLATHAALKFGAGAQHFDHQTELVKALMNCLDDQVTVLIKGSRAMAMENIVSELVRLISPNPVSCD